MIIVFTGSPFLSKQQALGVLRGDSAVSRLLSGSLGLRADISDGWEEILTTKGSKVSSFLTTCTCQSKELQLSSVIINVCLKQTLGSNIPLKII